MATAKQMSTNIAIAFAIDAGWYQASRALELTIHHKWESALMCAYKTEADFAQRADIRKSTRSVMPEMTVAGARSNIFHQLLAKRVQAALRLEVL